MLKNISLVIFIMSILLMVLALPSWFIMALMSIMIFDQGIHFSGLLFVLAIFLYPILFIFLSILSWRYFRRERYQLTALISALLLVPIFVVWIVVFHVDAQFWLWWFLWMRA